MPHTPLFRSEAFAGRSLGGRYGDVVEEIDASVGAVRDALAQADVLENTLIVFTSDNGPWLFMREEGGVSGLLRDGKGTTFEGGVRVPTVFNWPGTITPDVVSDLGSAMDLFSTVMTLVGGDAESATDGLDLSPRLLGLHRVRVTRCLITAGARFTRIVKARGKCTSLPKEPTGSRLRNRNMTCPSCFTCSAIPRSALMWLQITRRSWQTFRRRLPCTAQG